MPGPVLLNAFHSVSHLTSQSNYSKTHTRIPILLMSKRWGVGVGGEGEGGEARDRMSTTLTTTLFDVMHASLHKPWHFYQVEQVIRFHMIFTTLCFPKKNFAVFSHKIAKCKFHFVASPKRWESTQASAIKSGVLWDATPGHLLGCPIFTVHVYRGEGGIGGPFFL